MADYQRLDPREGAGRAVDTLCTGITGLITFVVLSGLSIAQIVIGAIKWDAACTEDRIALWLVVSGSTAIVTNLLALCNSKGRNAEGEDQPKYPAIACCSSLAGLFTLVWLIVGSAWILPYDAGLDYENCDQLLYLFAYWNILTVYILMGFFCALGCLVMCCYICCTPGPNTNV